MSNITVTPEVFDRFRLIAAKEKIEKKSIKNHSDMLEILMKDYQNGEKNDS